MTFQPTDIPMVQLLTADGEFSVSKEHQVFEDIIRGLKQEDFLKFYDYDDVDNPNRVLAGYFATSFAIVGIYLLISSQWLFGSIAILISVFWKTP